jgi:membrane-bound lytic murein transglycosylase B
MIHRLKNKYGLDRLQAMKRYSLTLAPHFLILIIPILLFSMAHGKDFNEIQSFYNPLIHRLSQDGFDAEFLSELLADPRAESIQAVMTISLNSGENPERYTQFLSPESIHLSKKFLHQNLKILRKAENRFHVEKEVTVSILLVESRFGENIGKYRVIPTLASMALMDSPENLQKNYSNLQETDPELSYEWIRDLAERKARWAYHELKCFLDIIRREQIDPL